MWVGIHQGVGEGNHHGEVGWMEIFRAGISRKPSERRQRIRYIVHMLGDFLQTRRFIVDV